MQEKRNKRLAFLLVLLTGVIIMIAFLNRGDQHFRVNRDLYRNVDLKAVDRVTFESPSEKTVLSFQGYRWKVNDSIEADRGLIEVLFATLQQAEPKRPVATSLQDSTARALGEHGIKVTLYAGTEKLKSFFAGGNEEKTQAIFLPEGGTEPHLISIPGYRVYVSGIFEIPSVAWRDKLIFNFNWQNFSKLEARYKNPVGDFDVVMQKNQVFIPQIDQSDTAKLNSYLDQVSLLTVEQFILRNNVTDSLSANQPILNLTVHDIANRSYQLSVFTSGNQFYGRIDQKTWGLLPQNRILPLLRSKDFFVTR